MHQHIVLTNSHEILYGCGLVVGFVGMDLGPIALFEQFFREYQLLKLLKYHGKKEQ